MKNQKLEISKTGCEVKWLSIRDSQKGEKLIGPFPLAGRQ